VHELRVVAAAEPGRELHHAGPVGADAELRVGRPVLDAERLGRAAGDLDRALPSGFGGPYMSERDAERRRICSQPVGHRQRVELTPHREGVHRHLWPVH
jgi:hypothetical protein